MNSPHDLVSPISRLLMSAIFVGSGLQKFTQREGMLQYANSKNLPMARVALPIAGATEVLGGLSLMTGIRGRWGAGALAAFLVPTTLVFHDFCNYQGQERQMQQVNFLKNVSLIGALMGVASRGTGALSLDQGITRLSDWRATRRVRAAAAANVNLGVDARAA